MVCVSLQYVVPLIIITLVYTKIYNFLQVRFLLSALHSLGLVMGDICYFIFLFLCFNCQERHLLSRVQKQKQKRTTRILLLFSIFFCLR